MRLITKFCKECGTVNAIPVFDIRDYEAWEKGTPIKKAMPYLRPNQVIALENGVCTRCYEKTHGKNLQTEVEVVQVLPPWEGSESESFLPGTQSV